MMNAARVGLAFSAILAISAAGGCGGSPPLFSDPVAGAGGAPGVTSTATVATVGTGGASGTSTADVPSNPVSIDITPAAVEALCQPPLGEKLPVDTIQAMKDTIRRSWALCSGQGIFAHAQAGITIGGDDRWAFLVWSGDHLVATTGLDNEGTVEYIDTSAMNGRPTIQVNFVNSYGWMFPVAPPTISDVPRMMVMTTMVVEPITYVAVP